MLPQFAELEWKKLNFSSYSKTFEMSTWNEPIFKNLNTSLEKNNFHLFFDERDIADMIGDFVSALPKGLKQWNINFLLFVAGLGT